jgi:hypothetical protein
MRRLSSLVASLGLVLGTAGVCAAGQPWEIKTAGGYLNGAHVVQSAAGAEQFREPPERGQQRFLAYDKEGNSPVVGKGEANQWEFVARGPGEFFIRAAEGKWKGWYLNTSDRAFKDGPSFGYLLELGKQPQTFYVYQVSK